MMSIKNYFSLLILITLPLAFYAQSISYPIDASHSVISFSVGFAGGVTSIDGRFNEFSGTIGYQDTKDRSNLFAEVTIQVKSINTGDAQRDEDLQGAGYFNVEQFPEISFKSKGVKEVDGAFMMTGTLSMMGKSQDLAIPFQFRHEKLEVWVFGEPRIAAQASLSIDRTEYGIPKRGWDNIIPTLGAMTLSKKVKIKLMIQGVGASLNALLLEKIEKESVSAAMEMYNQLEQEHAGKQTYTFGDRTLVGTILQLIRDKKPTEAIQVGEFTKSKYPDSFFAYYGLAIAHQNAGNKQEAIQNFEKTLVINPEFGRAKTALEKLKK